MSSNKNKKNNRNEEILKKKWELKLFSIGIIMGLAISLVIELLKCLFGKSFLIISIIVLIIGGIFFLCFGKGVIVTKIVEWLVKEDEISKKDKNSKSQ